MKNLRWIAVLFIVIALPSSAATENAIKFRAVQQEDRHHIYATNTAPALMSVVIEMTGTNISTDRVWPQTFVLDAGATLDLGYVRSADPKEGYRFNTRFYSLHGDFRVKEAPQTPCRLPYPDGEAYPMTQAFGGVLTSHADPLVQQAIDFTMPEGTSVLAACDGIVVGVVDTFLTGGIDKSFLETANQVTVQHEDGTVATYAHLFPHSAKVTVGQRVRAGELLAKSGNTGFSSGPHLHFAIMRPKLGDDKILRFEALPVHFYTGFPQRILVPVEGMLATASQDGPAKVEYQRANTKHVSNPENALEPIPPAPKQVPMAGNAPTIDTRPLIEAPVADSYDRYWPWLFLLVLLFIVARNWAPRTKQRRDDIDW